MRQLNFFPTRAMCEIRCMLTCVPSILSNILWYLVPPRAMGSFLKPEECFLKPRRDSVAKKDFVLAGDGYAWEPYDCRYDMISSEARRTCMEGANITRFLDLGDRCGTACLCSVSPILILFILIILKHCMYV